MNARDALAEALQAHDPEPYFPGNWADGPYYAEYAAAVLSSPQFARLIADAKAEAWEKAHDEFCPRAEVCSTHLRPRDRHLLADRSTS